MPFDPEFTDEQKRSMAFIRAHVRARQFYPRDDIRDMLRQKRSKRPAGPPNYKRPSDERIDERHEQGLTDMPPTLPLREHPGYMRGRFQFPIDCRTLTAMYALLSLDTDSVTSGKNMSKNAWVSSRARLTEKEMQHLLNVDLRCPIGMKAVSFHFDQSGCKVHCEPGRGDETLGESVMRYARLYTSEIPEEFKRDIYEILKRRLKAHLQEPARGDLTWNGIMNGIEIATYKKTMAFAVLLMLLVAIWGILNYQLSRRAKPPPTPALLDQLGEQLFTGALSRTWHLG